MPRRPRARSRARLLTIAALLCTFLAPDASVSAASTGSHPATSHATKKKKRKHKKARCTRYRTVRVKRGGHIKKVRRCVRPKCKKGKRWKTVRVKRGGHYKKVRRCVKIKKKGAGNTAPGNFGAGGPVTGPLIFGLNSVNPDDSTLSNVSGAGVSMVRLVLHWNDVQPSPGQYKWSGYDYVFGIEARHGITVLPTVMDDPSWAESDSGIIPSNPSAFADFTAHAAARYGPGGAFWAQNPNIPYHPATYWELWNEAWWYGFNSTGTDPGTYARLIRATAAATRAVNPQAKFLVDADLTGYPSPNTQVEWINAMYAAVPDLNNWFDGVSVHPYSWPDGPDVYDGPGDRWGFKRLTDIRAKFVAHGGQNKGLWITEVGYPTCPSNSRCVGEAAQASDLARIFQLVKTDYAGFTQAIFIYNYKDPAGQSSSDPEGWFGLLRSNGSPKPAWNVLRQATGAG